MGDRLRAPTSPLSMRRPPQRPGGAGVGRGPAGGPPDPPSPLRRLVRPYSADAPAATRRRRPPIPTTESVGTGAAARRRAASVGSLRRARRRTPGQGQAHHRRPRPAPLLPAPPPAGRALGRRRRPGAGDPRRRRPRPRCRARPSTSPGARPTASPTPATTRSSSSRSSSATTSARTTSSASTTTTAAGPEPSALPLGLEGTNLSASHARTPSRVRRPPPRSTDGLRAQPPCPGPAGPAPRLHGRAGRTRPSRSTATRWPPPAIPHFHPPVIEELKAEAKRARALEPLPPPPHRVDPRPGLQRRLRAARRDHRTQPDRPRGAQLRRARHRQHGAARPLRHARAAGALAGAAARTARSARASP